MDEQQLQSWIAAILHAEHTSRYKQFIACFNIKSRRINQVELFVECGIHIPLQYLRSIYKPFQYS